MYVWSVVTNFSDEFQLATRYAYANNYGKSSHRKNQTSILAVACFRRMWIEQVSDRMKVLFNRANDICEQRMKINENVKKKIAGRNAFSAAFA